MQKLESEEERMINNLMYIKLKTGYSDDGSAWIGYVKTSKSKKIIYFNDHAFQKNIGNYIDIENGHEYWISGLKKKRAIEYSCAMLPDSMDTEAGLFPDIIQLQKKKRKNMMKRSYAEQWELECLL